jgi:Cu2+-exporting ATPase
VFLVLGGRYLELRGRRRASDVVDALARLQPALAQRRTPNGTLETIGVHELETGDVVAVATGATVPADGVLLGAGCEVDESLLTGESTSRARHRGDTLIAGSVVRAGPVEMRVTHIGAQTVLSSIVRLVARAPSERPRSARLGDRIAAHFVAGVLLLALLTAGVWLWLDPSRAFAAALAVLVVSCPCAFALSVPTVYSRAAAALARMGLLVLKPDALEKLARVDHVVFDKTGTLTKNQLELLSVTPCSTQSSEQCLRIAAQLEEVSSHPLAAAIRAATTSASAAPYLRTFSGSGIEGDLDGHRYRIGRADFALQLSATNAHVEDDDLVVLADHGGALARFSFRETLRDDAASAIDKLRAQGLALSLLSGDSRARVAAVAARLGIGAVHARARPDEKLRILQALRDRGSVVAMVGDGINDAPVLAGADVAIALGGGAQLAQSSADIVLASDDLGAIADARALAQRTLQILRQNLNWAFVYNFSCIPLAAAGYIPPWLAAIGMSASSILVVLNSLRIVSPARAARIETGPRTIPAATATAVPA